MKASVYSDLHPNSPTLFRGIMSIFEKFNTQGMSPADAFEELCCQLFEYWGKGQGQFDGGWTFCNIRGAGGDGGIEAYWANGSSTECYAVQAKWFRSTLTSSQWGQIRNSVNQAIKIRPYLTQYIICIPHNLTSSKIIAHGRTSQGEDAAWRIFKSEIENDSPGLEVVLWDENEINNLLVQHTNEGLRRFWFEKTEVNPETLQMALDKTLARLKARYIPDINEDGGLSIFLDKYLGSHVQRKRLIDDIDGYLEACNTITSMIVSLIAAIRLDLGTNNLFENDNELVLKAESCKNAIECYANKLSIIKTFLAIEGDGLSRTEYEALCSDDISYSAIESFIDDIYGIKNEPSLQNHVYELKGALTSFREYPSTWELCREALETRMNPHCIVVGDQGTGKTCGFASKARAFQCGVSHVPILILASDIPENATWFGIIKQELGLSGTWDEPSLWQALSTYVSLRDIKTDSMLVRSKVAIMVDGLDEKQSSYFWEEKIHEGDAITNRYPRIRFIYSSRPWLINKFEDDQLDDCCYEIATGGDVPVYELFDRYTDHYRIRIEGETQYRYLLNTPNELKLFCNVYKGQTLNQAASTTLSQLTSFEIKRLDTELEKQLSSVVDISRMKPVNTALSSLSQHFMDHESIDEVVIGQNLSQFGISGQAKDATINLLIRYGILLDKKSERTFQEVPDYLNLTEPTCYKPGSRHLWDYCIAQRLLQSDAKNFKEIMASNRNATMLYGVLLVEKKGILPSNDPRLIEAIDEDDLRKIDLYALSNADPNATEKFRPWVLELLRAGGQDFSDVVNGIVARVANYPNHPLGTALLDDYLNSFESPIERDIVWSLPVAAKMDLRNSQLAYYEERRHLKNLPRLDGRETAGQMPLLFAWKLSSLSNLERSHYRRELIKWGMKNPLEFACIFEKFDNCNDPQIREDVFAIAEEIVCQGELEPAAMQRFYAIAIDAVFKCPDKQGNRDAAIRNYARLLAEHCNMNGLLATGEINSCRPPYSFDLNNSVMPINKLASHAKAMHGYGPIHYDLARYVLVDRLASAFHRPQVPHGSNGRYAKLKEIMEASALKAEIDGSLEFEGWIISAAYQYLLDHGFDEAAIQGTIGEDGYRTGGIDRSITIAFGRADHGLRSTVMTIAEKYIWCARNEICGYLADRITISEECPMHQNVQDNAYCSDYRNLLSFESPLFEDAVMRATNLVRSKTPHFPKAFSSSGFDQLSKEEFEEWIKNISSECAFAMLGYNPTADANVEILKGRKGRPAIPIALYSCDWGVNGKNSRIWIHGGVISREEFKELDSHRSTIVDFNEGVSSFITSIALSQSVCYIAPTVTLASPQMIEIDESELVNKNSRVHSRLMPLSGQGVDRLVEKDDYWYFFPSKMAREAAKVKRTDGVHYFNNEGETIFEEVRFGPEFRHQYHALLADGEVLRNALREKGFELVWYATVQRGPNALVGERLGCDFDFSEKSWLIWEEESGKFDTCPIERGVL